MNSNQVKSQLIWAVQQLIDSPTAALDAQLLLAKVLGVEVSWLLTWPEKELSDAHIGQFLQSVQRRVLGEPIAYILGRQGFWNLDLEVNKHTLIPRPETELLVETILQWQLPKNAKVLDLGTGTGAIALALAAERPHWQITAVDLSATALETAKRNAQSNQIQNVQFVHSSWYSAFTSSSIEVNSHSSHQYRTNDQFDLTVSNPPYVDPSSEFLSQGDVRFEPKTALIAPQKGLKDLRHIILSSSKYLVSNGRLLVEHGFDQQAQVMRLFSEAGFQSVLPYSDISGLPRAVSGQLTV